MEDEQQVAAKEKTFIWEKIVGRITLSSVRQIDSGGGVLDDKSKDCVNHIDNDVCFVCGDEEDIVYGWIGCNSCNRILHRGCRGTQQEVVMALEKDELGDSKFLCCYCEQKGKQKYICYF